MTDKAFWLKTTKVLQSCKNIKQLTVATAWLSKYFLYCYTKANEKRMEDCEFLIECVLKRAEEIATKTETQAIIRKNQETMKQCRHGDLIEWDTSYDPALLSICKR
jgi:hypothetical protein